MMVIIKKQQRGLDRDKAAMLSSYGHQTAEQKPTAPLEELERSQLWKMKSLLFLEE